MRKAGNGDGVLLWCLAEVSEDDDDGCKAWWLRTARTLSVDSVIVQTNLVPCQAALCHGHSRFWSFFCPILSSRGL